MIEDRGPLDLTRLIEDLEKQKRFYKMLVEEQVEQLNNKRQS